MRASCRKHLFDIFRAGLDRVKGRDVVCSYLEEEEAPAQRLQLVAVGKAASAMTLGAIDAFGGHVAGGLVITKHGHLDDRLASYPQIQCLESDHPVPGDASLHAGRMLLDYLDRRAQPGVNFLFLLSGGASSLVEVLPETMTLDDLKHLTRVLLSHSLDITQMNAVRRAVSCIKGGRLAARLQGCRVTNLLISDVPGDDPGVVGSGLLTPVRETVRPDDYPDEVAEILRNTPTMPVPADEVFADIKTHIIARLDDAKQRCVKKASVLGYDVFLVERFIEGDAAAAGEALCRELLDSEYQVLVWGGETSVKLPQNPGRGGRNQHLALSAALALQGSEGVYLLSGGTDGTDGPTTAAGGIADGGTVARGKSRGLDAEDSLAKADSGPFLEAAGDLITTGPTGTNVMDLMLGIKMS